MTRPASRQQSRSPSARWTAAAIPAAGVALLLTLAALAQTGGDPPRCAPPTTPTNPEAPVLTSRPLPKRPALQALEVGQELRTKSGERKLLALPGVGTLYVNENSEVTLEAADRLVLAAGEVFVEQAPHVKAAAFTVQAPGRKISSKGSSFALRAGEGGTAVVVTRGQVQVAGVQEPVRGGRMLPAGGKESAPAPRPAQVLHWTQELMTAAEPALVPASQYAGGALVAVDPQGQESKLSLRKYHIDVYLEDGFARTTIDQTYFNHENFQTEGTFYFPLPPDASLSRLAMYVDGKLMEGGMVDREHGAEVYETIKYMKRDPALLEWVDGSTFRMKVFPLEGRKEKRIILSYVQKLPATNGQAQYRFPAGHSLPAVNLWSLNVRVKGGAAIDCTSPSHKLEKEKEGGDLVLSTQQKNALFNKDVVLLVRDPALADDAARKGLFATAEFEGHQYLMAALRPDLLRQDEAAPAPAAARNWLFLFESSGDRDPLLARVQIEVLRNLLLHAGPQDTFNVLAANTKVRSLAESPQPVTSTAVAEAVAFLEKSHLIGALDLAQAFAAATSACAKQADQTFIVHLGGGIPAMGERRLDVLARGFPAGSRYIGVGVGRRWNRSLMKAAAEQTGGYFTQINPDEGIIWRSFELAGTLEQLGPPGLRKVEISGVLPAADKQPAFLYFNQLLARGEELCAVTRLDGKAALPKGLKLKYADGKEVEVPVQQVKKNANYLPRMWAKLEIDRLVAQDIVKNKKDIIALSKAMYVMSPYTSLLVLENEDMYKQYGVDKGRKDHWALYPAPESIEVVYEPEPGVPVKGKNDKSPQQILQTIAFGGKTTSVPPLYFGYGDYGMLQGGDGEAEVAFPPLAGSPAQNPIVESALKSAPKLSLFPLGRLGEAAGVPRLSKQIQDQKFVQGQTANTEELGRSFDFAANGMFAKKRINDASFQQKVAERGFDGIAFRDAGKMQLEKGDWEASPDKLPESHLFARESTAALKIHPVGTVPITGADVTKDDVFRRLNLDVPPQKRNGKGDSKQSYSRSDLEKSFLYSRPQYTNDHTVFSNLLAYAPGLNTTTADVLAVLEAEAYFDKPARSGHVPGNVQNLFNQARKKFGWHKLTLEADKGEPASTVLFNGRGHFAYNQTLSPGLKEGAACDGKTLAYLYPQLGLAAQRKVSRFHRSGISTMLPWVVPPADDLARGADLKLVDDRTVEIIPHGSGKMVKDKDGKEIEATSYRLRIVFSADGPVAERQIVEMPKNKVLLRQVCEAKGSIRLLDDNGKELSLRKGALTAVDDAPNLAPSTKELIVLDLPYRTPDHVRQTLKIEKKSHAELTFAQATALLAAYVAQGNGNEARNVFQQALHNRNERQLGYYVLLASAGQDLGGQGLNVVDDHPDSGLAQYLALHTNAVLREQATQWAVGSVQWKDPMLKHLATTHALYQRWQSKQVEKWTPERLEKERDLALKFVRDNQRSAFGWVMLSLLQDRAGKDKAVYGQIADHWKLFQDWPGLGYAARYEQARCLSKAGEDEQAREQFTKLYQDTFKDGGLPPLDGDFRRALLGGKDADGWSQLLQKSAQKLIADKHRPAVLALAWQCWQLDDAPQADQLVQLALANIEDKKERDGMRLAAALFYRQTKQLPQADQLLGKLLADADLAKYPGLWRLAGNVAQQRGQAARSIECLERALDLEFKDLPDVINLQRVRQDYGRLLDHYQGLADSLIALKLPAPEGFVARVVKAADRWRALDADAKQACNTTAGILRTLGQADLGWDYLTTPIGLRPNEPGPWLNLAGSLRVTGEVALADLAYKAAYECEPTNAQALWDRAENLQQAGKAAPAEVLYRQIAEGHWGPQYAGLVAQAKLRVK